MADWVIPKNIHTHGRSRSSTNTTATGTHIRIPRRDMSIPIHIRIQKGTHIHIRMAETIMRTHIENESHNTFNSKGEVNMKTKKLIAIVLCLVMAMLTDSLATTSRSATSTELQQPFCWVMRRMAWGQSF